MNHARRKDLSEMLGKQKLSARATGQPLKRTAKEAKLGNTVAVPFNLSASKRQRLDLDQQELKEEYVPLKIQLDRAFN